MNAKERRHLTPLFLLHADEHLLVINKPAGALSIRGRTEDIDVRSILKELRLIGPQENLRIVHRLDRDASGVMVLARTVNAQRHLTHQFVRRSVEKVYLALVQGILSADGEVNLPLHVIEGGMRAVVASSGGKASVTRYHVLEHLAGNTLVECRPFTGRLHQIRVHMESIGHPLCVDPLYGGGKTLYLSSYKPDYHPSRRHEEHPLIERLTLHAARITFDHPAGTGPATFEAPLPKDFRATLNQLRRLAGASAGPVGPVEWSARGKALEDPRHRHRDHPARKSN
jgi:23S rRNA pseudouridine1911/1915/1917 synthase